MALPPGREFRAAVAQAAQQRGRRGLGLIDLRQFDMTEFPLDDANAGSPTPPPTPARARSRCCGPTGAARAVSQGGSS
ncbi:MAG TPA: hypothetical protein VHZ26_01840 [Caulobacteraceae bacterium]|nr:hypothetical protein [Caulobacteraceae bacterium]